MQPEDYGQWTRSDNDDESTRAETMLGAVLLAMALATGLWLGWMVRGWAL